MKDLTAEQIRILNKDNLFSMYQKMSANSIAKEIGVSESLIFNRLKLYNIKRRKSSRPRLT